MVVYAKLFLTALFWGGTFVAARVVAAQVGPFSASFLRFFTASLFLVVLLAWREGALPRLTRRQLLAVLLLGLTGVFGYNLFFFLGMKRIDAGRASLIVATNPVFISLLSALLFRQRLGVRRAAGILLCLTGAALVITRGTPLAIAAGGLGAGELLIFGCVGCWVAYSLVGRAVMREISPLQAVTCSCLTGTLLLFVPACVEGLPRQIAALSATDALGLLYLGFFGTVLGFYWYYEGIRAIGPARASVFINFVPVSGVFFGWLLLGEAVNLSLALGALLVTGGVFLTNRPD